MLRAGGRRSLQRMLDVLSARRLDAQAAIAAFPLVSLRYPELTLTRWRLFVRRSVRRSDGRHGLIGIVDARGTVLAVLSYRFALDVTAKPLLRVSDIVTGRLPGAPLRRLAMQAAVDLAREFESATIEMDVAGDTVAPHDRSALDDGGFTASSVAFTRRLSS